MKFLTGFFLAFGCLILTGAEKPVRIADTVGDTVFRSAAVRLTLTGQPVACSQEKVTVEKALAGLQKGEYDLVLAYRSAVPEKQQKFCRDYAVDAVMIAMNAGNSRNGFTTRELAETFSGEKRSWLTLNGNDFQIHLMRLPDAASAVRIFRDKVMKKRPFAPAFIRENPMELLRLAVLNENALVLTCRPDMELATGLKAAAVDEVYPSLENVKNGRYPLVERRTVLLPEKPSAGVQMLLKTVLSADMENVIAEHGLIRP